MSKIVGLACGSKRKSGGRNNKPPENKAPNNKPPQKPETPQTAEDKQ